MTVLHSFRREFVYLLTCGRRNLVSGTQNDIVVRWITLWGMIKVYWLDDLTLAKILEHAVCCASAASSGRSLHLIISPLRTKHSSSNCPHHVRRTMRSIKKRRKVRRILRTMFGEATLRPVKNGLKALSPFLIGWTFASPNIVRSIRRTLFRFLLELKVRRTWFGQFDELHFVLNWLIMRCKLRPELATVAQQTAWSKM